MPDTSQDEHKRRVAERALHFVQDGMRLGLGSGSTARIFVDLLAARVRADGLTLRCVATSEATHRQAAGAGLDVTTLDDLSELDLTIDGADEFDPRLNLIKGGGGALLREKIVATASRSMIVIADRSKRVQTLGGFPLPVEVNRFGLAATTRMVLKACGSAEQAPRIVLRTGSDGQPFVTDGGHLILDCHLAAIDDPWVLAGRLVAVPGVVEHGLFLGIAQVVITDTDDDVDVLRRAA